MTQAEVKTTTFKKDFLLSLWFISSFGILGAHLNSMYTVYLLALALWFIKNKINNKTIKENKILLGITVFYIFWVTIGEIIIHVNPAYEDLIINNILGTIPTAGKFEMIIGFIIHH